jgi:hypothetical protein
MLGSAVKLPSQGAHARVSGLVKHADGEARRDQTRQDKTRQDKTRQDKTRQDKTRLDETRRDETRRDETWGAMFLSTGSLSLSLSLTL